MPALTLQELQDIILRMTWRALDSVGAKLRTVAAAVRRLRRVPVVSPSSSLPPKMITDIGFRAPRDLEVNDLPVNHVLVIGSCLIAAIPEFIPTVWAGASADWIALNNVATLPDEPPRPVREYSFQIIQTATRSILREQEYMVLKYDQPDDWRRLFDEVVGRLELVVEGLMRYNREHGLLTFFSNFLVPQQNPLGRLLPRNDYRDLTFFFRELNRELERMVRGYSNAYVLDVEEIAASLGKRYILDDSMWVIAHNSVYGPNDESADVGRIHKPTPVAEKFQSKAYDFVLECLNELRACYRSVRGADSIKLVVTDLDDTLWRGVSGEWDRPQYTDGWPPGYAEALALCSQRGVLLAVISKNDHDAVLQKWSSIIRPETFSVLKVNWLDKVSNMTEILETVNLLPQNVLFLDDNPVERENMRQAFPGLRVAGADPHLMRRLLLWAPEMQQAQISQESARRKEMMDGQVQRESARRSMTREEFLASLQLQLTLELVAKPVGATFERCLELINKTNQFNTTGQRWAREDLAAFLESGGTMAAVDCSDKFTRYGVISVVLADAAGLRQMVLSCRVFGLGVEEAIIHEVVERMGWRGEPLQAAFRETGKNRVSLDNLSAIGFEKTSELLVAESGRLKPRPGHIRITS